MVSEEKPIQNSAANIGNGIDTQPLVSVIMPIYNEAAYIQSAIESVLMQKTDFAFELIIVDDCSTDETSAIIEPYLEKHPHVLRYIKNEKNSGNAYSFWHGLHHSNSDFFHVLDGDDFFLSAHKLQMQVNFLHAHPECSAVATNSLRLMADGSISPERMPGNGTCFFTYEQVLRCEFYLHTSAYLYRNIFKNNIPDFLKEEWARGDTIRTILVAKGHKVGFIDTIASVYRFHQKGIWTSMTQEEQINRTIRVFKEIQNNALESRTDKALFNDTIKDWEDAKLPSRWARWLNLLSTPRRIPSRIRKGMLTQRLVNVLFKTSRPAHLRSFSEETRIAMPRAFKPWHLRIPPDERNMIHNRLIAELADNTKDETYA